MASLNGSFLKGRPCWTQRMPHLAKRRRLVDFFLHFCLEFHGQPLIYVVADNVLDRIGTNQRDIMSVAKMFAVNQRLLSEPVCRFALNNGSGLLPERRS